MFVSYVNHCLNLAHRIPRVITDNPDVTAWVYQGRRLKYSISRTNDDLWGLPLMMFFDPLPLLPTFGTDLSCKIHTTSHTMSVFP